MSTLTHGLAGKLKASLQPDKPKAALVDVTELRRRNAELRRRNAELVAKLAQAKAISHDDYIGDLAINTEVNVQQTPECLSCSDKIASGKFFCSDCDKYVSAHGPKVQSEVS